LRLLIFGGTGFIGTALAEALSARGDEVWIVTRKQPESAKSSDRATTVQYATWDDWEQSSARFEGFDAIVNLTGESINQRWTAAAKRRIVESREQAAARIAAVMRRMTAPPPVVVNASGISLYGHSLDNVRGIKNTSEDRAVFDENSPVNPADFLGDTVIAWEAAADKIPAGRLVKLRIGLVIARSGGAFPLLRLPYRLFVGGRMGHGRQGMPWIHLQDMIGLILFSLDHPEVRGPLNAVAPEPVASDAFGRVLASAMHRPHWFPVPGAMLKLLLGEMSTLVLTGQLAMPRRALELGYEFAYPRLEDALRDLVR